MARGITTRSNTDASARSFAKVAAIRSRRGLLCILPALALLSSLQTVDASSSSFASSMQTASQARHVPLSVVEAIAYVNTRWEWINTPEMDGGVGPMKVTPAQMSLATSLTRHS